MMNPIKISGSLVKTSKLTVPDGGIVPGGPRACAINAFIVSLRCFSIR